MKEMKRKIPRKKQESRKYEFYCAIMFPMSKTILVAGKNMPEASSFTDGISHSGRNIIVSGNITDSEETRKLTIAERKANQAAYEEEKAQEAKTGMCTIEWNRSSPLSARSLVLQTTTIFGGMDEAVLYFDEEQYAAKAEKMDSEEIVRGCDEMIAGYQYLTLEILNSFQKRDTSEGKGRLVFLMKKTPDRIDVLKNPSVKNGLSPIASPLVAAGAAAFASFAENIAAVCSDSIFVDVLLIRGETSMEGFRRDDETGRLVCTCLDSLSSSSDSTRREVRWISKEQKKIEIHAELSTPAPATKKRFGIFRKQK